MDRNLLDTFFEGKVDATEKSRIVDWASASKENSQLFIEAKADWTLRNFPNERASADDFLRFSKHTTKIVDSLPIKRKKKSFANLYRIAAMIAVPLLFAAVFQIVRLSQELRTHDNYLAIAETPIAPEQRDAVQEHIVNAGVKGRVVLPDGSEVWLNSKSLLRSPSRFDSDSRIVELEGEAFFRINSSEDWPFYIHTQRGVSVRVTGTEFSISSYANDPFVRVTLIEGSLTVIDHASERVFDMQPMQELVLQNNIIEEFTHEKVLNAQENIVWKDGFLLFANTPFDAVVRRMERWYGVTITVENPEILDFLFTATFESESLSQVLEILKLSSNIQHRIVGNQVSLFL